MATWKKIITSGSNAELSQITASTGIDVPNDSISGDKIEGGTIGSTTINSLAGSLSLGDFNITNVGDIDADSISIADAASGLNINFSGADTGTSKLTLKDNVADALNITEGSNSYIKFTTTNNQEEILFSKNTKFTNAITSSGDISGSGTSTGSFGQLELSGGTFTSASLASAIEANAVTSYTNPTDNRIITSTGAGGINGESNLTFDGNHMLIASNGEIRFGDTGTFIHQEADGQLDIVSDSEVGIQATTIDIDGTVDISGNTTIGGNLTVNGTTTTIATANTEVKDQFLLLASGSSETNLDAGIIVQSGSVAGTGSAFYHDQSDERWAVGKSLSVSRTEATSPTQFVTTVKTDAVNPDSTSGSYGAGEMHVNTSTGEIWIRFG